MGRRRFVDVLNEQYRRHQLVVVVLPEGKPTTQWHRYHADVIVRTIKEARDYIHSHPHATRIRILT